MMNLRFVAVFSSSVALLAGCTQSDTDRYKAEIIAADKAFSASSIKDGPKAAFLAAIERDCKLLGHSPTGADAVREVFIQLPPTAKLTWEPSFVGVSASGDLGYTWGRYILNVPMTKLGAAPLIRIGTYVTVWKRQPGGAWKIAFHGGDTEQVR
jgi:ketosteroid isomerase-like protein